MDAAEWAGGARKRCRSHLKRREHQPAVLFPLQDDRGRWEVAHSLFWYAREQEPSTYWTAFKGMKLCYPHMEPEALLSINKQVLLMILEFHLARASQGTRSVTPVIPEVLESMLPPLDEYLSGEFQGS